MDNKVPAPSMTAGKAIWSTIAALLTSIVLTLLGVLPSSELLLADDLRQLVENVAALAIMAGVPGIVAFYKRNYPK